MRELAVVNREKSPHLNSGKNRLVASATSFAAAECVTPEKTKN